MGGRRSCRLRHPPGRGSGPPHAFVQQHRPRLQRSIRGEHGGQLVDLHHHRVQRGLCHVRVRGRHRDDRLPDVAHPLDGQGRLVPVDRPVPGIDALPGGQVRARQDAGHARDAFGGTDVNGADAPMRHVASKQPAMEHPGEGQTAGERHITAHPLARVNDPRGRRGWLVLLGQEGARRSSSARRRDAAEFDDVHAGACALGARGRVLGVHPRHHDPGPRLGRRAPERRGDLFGRRHADDLPGWDATGACHGRQVGALSAGRGDQAAAGAVDAVVDGQHRQVGRRVPRDRGQDG